MDALVTCAIPRPKFSVSKGPLALLCARAVSSVDSGVRILHSKTPQYIQGVLFKTITFEFLHRTQLVG